MRLVRDQPQRCDVSKTDYAEDTDYDDSGTVKLCYDAFNTQRKCR